MELNAVGRHIFGYGQLSMKRGEGQQPTIILQRSCHDVNQCEISSQNV